MPEWNDTVDANAAQRKAARGRMKSHAPRLRHGDSRAEDLHACEGVRECRVCVEHMPSRHSNQITMSRHAKSSGALILTHANLSKGIPWPPLQAGLAQGMLQRLGRGQVAAARSTRQSQRQHPDSLSHMQDLGRAARGCPGPRA